MTAEAATSAPLLGEPLPVEFMNTIWADRAGIHDALATDEEALGWLRSVRPRLGVPGDHVNEWLIAGGGQDVRETASRLRALRDALRRLAAEQTSDPRERAASAMSEFARAVKVVNEAAAAAPHWNHLAWQPGGEAAPESRTGVAPGLAISGAIAEQGIALFTSATVAGLRACLAPSCVLYFVKQHARREWCSTACGNRTRAARHYHRHHIHP